MPACRKPCPALSYSQEIQHRVAEAGFDWESDRGVIEKLAEEVAELARAESAGQKAEEFGDILFTLVNVGRRQGIDAEVALREANAKFFRRFRYMEELCRQRGLNFTACLSMSKTNCGMKPSGRRIGGKNKLWTLFPPS